MDSDTLIQQVSELNEEVKKKSTTVSTLTEQISELTSRLTEKNSTVDGVNQQRNRDKHLGSLISLNQQVKQLQGSWKIDSQWASQSWKFLILELCLISSKKKIMEFCQFRKFRTLCKLNVYVSNVSKKYVKGAVKRKLCLEIAENPGCVKKRNFDYSDLARV